MLFEQFGSPEICRALQTGDGFAPFPRHGDREGWGRVLPETRAAWLAMAEQYKDFTWPALSAGLYLHFSRTGENLPYLFAFFERRSALGILAIAECMEGRGRFIGQIVSGLWCVCEETAWMTPFDVAKNGECMPAAEDRVVDLANSETGALLAWIRYLLREELDKISPRICRRIEREISYRLVEPYLAHDDYWWMGFVDTPRINNWNPWCNRNMLMCLLLLDIEEPVRTACIQKLMRSLDAYLAAYPADGCCDEGPMYWGAAGGGLHTCLKLLQAASGGVINIFGETIVRDIGRYIYKAHIHGPWFVDFADGDAQVRPAPAVYHYGRSIADENLAALGAAAGPSRPAIHNWFGAYEFLLDIFSEEERGRAAASAPYVRDAWMPHTGVLFARERAGSPEGLYMAAKAGHNGESHNHNDIGGFIVYMDGCPLLIDLGTEEYSAKTFSPQRFELWYLQSQYHNCPTVRGVMQHEGKQYAARGVACECNDSCAALSADIAGAYPAEAGLEYWHRAVRLSRGEGPRVEVTDDYRLTGPAADVEWNLMTPHAPEIAAPGEIVLEYAEGRHAAIAFDAALEARVERIDTMESRLRANWGDVMYRIVLREKTPVPQAKRTLTVTRIK